MGWFSVAPVVANTDCKSDSSAQTIALCVLAAVAVGYVAIRAIARLHSHSRYPNEHFAKCVKKPWTQKWTIRCGGRNLHDA